MMDDGNVLNFGCLIYVVDVIEILRRDIEIKL